jgi:integrase
MRGRGLSAATVNGARQILNALCKHAARTGVIPSNPVLATDPVKRQSTDRTQVRQHWALDEMWKVLEAARADELDSFLHLLIHTGMRPGEALGLRWQDVDLDGRLVHISGTLKESRTLNSDGSGVVRLLRNTPKTEASHRTLAISEALVDSLIRQRTRQADQQEASGHRWTDSGFVITTSVGTPCSLSNIRKQFRAFLESIGVRYIRLHDIRHSVATASLNEGRMPIEQTSQALGHSRIDTTKRIYARNVPRYNHEFIEGMSRILPPSPNGESDRVLEPAERLFG